MRTVLVAVLLALAACEPSDPTVTYPTASVTFVGPNPTCEGGGELTMSLQITPPWFYCTWSPGAWWEGKLCTPLIVYYQFETSYWRPWSMECSGVISSLR